VLGPGSNLNLNDINRDIGPRGISVTIYASHFLVTEPRRRGVHHLYSNIFLLHPTVRPTLSAPTTPIIRLGTLSSNDDDDDDRTERASPTLYIRRNRHAQSRHLPRHGPGTIPQALDQMVFEYDHGTGTFDLHIGKK